MESCELGDGGVAVKTNETVASPPPQFKQTPETPLQEARNTEVKIRTALVKTWRIMKHPAQLENEFRRGTES
jgi:hypothetical protein